MEIGDCVQLKSGGPKMTIQRFIGDDATGILQYTDEHLIKMQGFKKGDVMCQWFADNNELKSGTFKKRH